mmetsp:Transcript_23749/g.76331  ORF Transcript_23749/g.76331 Transcript_23749/m.76331 type:complete len:312 (-) Transcript_23749:30-965(-)
MRPHERCDASVCCRSENRSRTSFAAPFENRSRSASVTSDRSVSRDSISRISSAREKYSICTGTSACTSPTRCSASSMRGTQSDSVTAARASRSRSMAASRSLRSASICWRSSTAWRRWMRALTSVWNASSISACAAGLLIPFSDSPASASACSIVLFSSDPASFSRTSRSSSYMPSTCSASLNELSSRSRCRMPSTLSTPAERPPKEENGFTSRRPGCASLASASASASASCAFPCAIKASFNSRRISSSWPTASSCCSIGTSTSSWARSCASNMRARATCTWLTGSRIAPTVPSSTKNTQPATETARIAS